MCVPSEDPIPVFPSSGALYVQRSMPPTTRSSTRAQSSVPMTYLWKLFLVLYAFRAWNALAVKTYFDPDEYWQALEIAHEYVFQFPFIKLNQLAGSSQGGLSDPQLQALLASSTRGYITWEWIARIRGFFHPALFAGVYQAVKVLGLENTEMLVCFFCSLKLNGQCHECR